MMAERRLLTPAEAAAFLGTTEGTLAVWRHSGKHRIPFVRSGRVIRYRLADLERWAAAHVVTGPSTDMANAEAETQAPAPAASIPRHPAAILRD
jgi:excisionase family DNA binding protein